MCLLIPRDIDYPGMLIEKEGSRTGSTICSWFPQTRFISPNWCGEHWSEMGIQVVDKNSDGRKLIRIEC